MTKIRELCLILNSCSDCFACVFVFETDNKVVSRDGNELLGCWSPCSLQRPTNQIQQGWGPVPGREGQAIPPCIPCSSDWSPTDSLGQLCWRGTSQRLASFCWHHLGGVAGYSKLRRAHLPARIKTGNTDINVCHAWEKLHRSLSCAEGTLCPWP